MARPSQKRQVGVEVSPEMIQAGTEVLRHSGLLEANETKSYLNLIVVDVYRAMRWKVPTEISQDRPLVYQKPL